MMEHITEQIAELEKRRAAAFDAMNRSRRYDEDDRRIEDIEALDATGYNWNLIHGTGLCGTERTPFEGWRCILCAPGLEMAGYDGTTMHRAISGALLAHRRSSEVVKP